MKRENILLESTLGSSTSNLILRKDWTQQPNREWNKESQKVKSLLKNTYREDMYSQDSIDLLANSGLQFQKHEEEGIDTLHFAELLMTSGVVLCDNVKWLSFHSGYDFGYMVKLLTDSRLPEEEHEFFHILNLFFPSIYDVKYLMKSCKNLKGGLQEVADQLDLQRIGRQHQAGSDSLLTGMAFFRMKELFFEDSIDDAKYCGRLYGLGTGVAQKQNEDVDSAQEKMSILAIINNMQQ
ncbi:CCR4-NOT transcription complex subunit 8 isoform X2 [Neofelis nebulosa]|uniref:poly(A)-specific ribonuclease n=1 Tax=Acinonyx jubatus TaxID=32536 RepID=A0A6J2AZ32_ACIJB|nr:CCR4-NOT transcription complex subunit 8 isoform X3 [Felis catus]XP_026933460.1 CCR4-NOT transcription complex subunit 8 isoform X3 [Acinonyx jubatus]XP_040298917.1 CCR4-NOT transcription complex subunit 8 isoform X2 [Puma yagouaroundi]XP_043453521.1 CCR4-NOT transcription complex subunit 8 isoform X2 [Prionailurus bengalensis]XP_058577147.1 CCR4-NOT transcription complex subunit 8 isoform X2 [Neofelis nebulosa]